MQQMAFTTLVKKLRQGFRVDTQNHKRFVSSQDDQEMSKISKI